MSDLHPAARALIEAAKRNEASLSADARSQVHRSVLRRAVAFGAAMATTTSASVTAKAGALATLITSPLAISGVVTALAGVTFVVARAVWAPSPATSEPTPAPAPAVAAPDRVSRAVPELAPALAAPASVEMSSPVAASAAESPPPQAPPPPTTTTLAQSTTTTSLPRPRLATDTRPAAGAPPAPVLQGQLAQATAGATLTAAPGEAGLVELNSMPAPEQAPKAHAPTTLALQLDVLHQVHESLQARHPSQALRLIDGNAVLLQTGPLAEESQAARIAALCQLGRESEARSAIDRFVVSWPRSPLAVEVRQGCRALGTAR